MKKTYSLIISSMLLAGCGGGGDSSIAPATETTPNTAVYKANDNILSGVAAIGSPLVNARVSIHGSEGNSVNATTDEDGEYSADITSLTPPLLVRVVDDSNGIELYSYATDDSGANITPITSVIVSQSMPSTASLRAFLDGFSEIDQELFQTEMEAAIARLNNLINNNSFSEHNHFRQPFEADSTGYDLILDQLNIAYDGMSINIQDSNYTPIITTVDIQAMEENDDATLAAVSGRITAGLSSTPITTATISARNAYTGDIYTVSSNESGGFILELPRYNVFDIIIEAEGYQDAQYLNMSTFSASSQISIALIPILDQSETTPVTYNALVIDATTNNTAIEAAAVNIRSGLNNQYGDVLHSSTTGTNGQISFADLMPGTYTLELIKEGFYTRYENVFVDSSTVSTTDNLYMRSELDTSDITTSADLTVILSWGENPSDLDSHLTGPIQGSTERFHTWYSNRCWADTNLDETAVCTGAYDEETYETSEPDATAFLDRDDTNSFGPETTTIKQVIPGEYNFYVHHYSGAGSISTSSSAQVIVIDKYGQDYTFNAPVSGGSGDNDIWHVFTTDADGNIIPVNTLTENGNTSSLRNASNQENIRAMINNLPEKE